MVCVNQLYILVQYIYNAAHLLVPSGSIFSVSFII